jgi:hypothetical protein
MHKKATKAKSESYMIHFVDFSLLHGKALGSEANFVRFNDILAFAFTVLNYALVSLNFCFWTATTDFFARLANHYGLCFLLNRKNDK